MRVREIWSGGQTGVDRAALDAAGELGLTTGGWIPRGRRAEDDVIPDAYRGLRETESEEYAVRTSWNVRDSDATLIVTRGLPGGGTAYTQDEAIRLGKPWLVLDLSALSADQAVETARTWLDGLGGARLNVAGPRASAAPGIYEEARALLVRLLRQACAP